MVARFSQGSIRWQIVTLAVFPIVLVGLLGILTEPIFPEDTELSRAEVVAAQIDLVTGQIEEAETEEESAAILAATRRSGLDVRWSESSDETSDVHFAYEERLLFALSKIHGRSAHVFQQDSGPPRIVVGLEERSLEFRPDPMSAPGLLNDTVIDILLSVLLIALPVVFLSMYAARLITDPLIRIAEEARTLREDDLHEIRFVETGPLEIRLLARRLNEMRAQINVMLKERTAMLRAVSHDLRTPLTRLKLRVERSVSGESAALVMRDIAAINDMINDILNYLRSNTETEARRNADLPSLLRTICSDFSDIGFDVTYTGPERLTFNCRSRSIARAVSNLVDNGTKHGASVEVRLMAFPDGAVRIEVSDDGPGIAEDMRARVLEPFVKGDPARNPSLGSGFGLGLTIVQEVVRGHGGDVGFAPRAPSGLAVVLTIPAEGARVAKFVPRDLGSLSGASASGA